MKKLNHFINEDKVPGGKGDNAPDSKFDAEELKKGIKHEMEHTDDKEVATEIAKDHLSEDPQYYTKLEAMEDDEDEDTIAITVDLDIPDEDDLKESDLNERRIRQTKKMKNSAKVVRETTEELFGKEGTQRALADKIFKIFKRELKIKSKELGVPLGQVRQWKIVLRDFDAPKVNTNIN